MDFCLYFYFISTFYGVEINDMTLKWKICFVQIIHGIDCIDMLGFNRKKYKNKEFFEF